MAWYDTLNQAASGKAPTVSPGGNNTTAPIPNWIQTLNKAAATIQPPTPSPTPQPQSSTPFFSGVGNIIGGAVNDIKGWFTPSNQNTQIPLKLPTQPTGIQTPVLKGTNAQTTKNISGGIASLPSASPAPKKNLIDNLFSTITQPLTPGPTLAPGQTKLTDQQTKDIIAKGGSVIGQGTPQQPSLLDRAGQFIDNLFGISPQRRDQITTADVTGQAQAIYNIAKNAPQLLKGTTATSLSEPGGNPFHQSDLETAAQKYALSLGFSPAPTNAQFTDLMFALSLPVSLAAGAAGLAPTVAKQLASIGTFTAVTTAFDKTFQAITGKTSVSELLPDTTPQVVKVGVDGLELLGKVLATHGLMTGASKVGPGLLDAFTKSTIEKYNLPQSVTITSNQLRDIHQTGTLTTQEEKDFISQAFSGNQQAYVDAIKGKQDVTINIPSSKIVTVTDKPYWAKIKGMFGVSSEPSTTTTFNGDINTAPSIKGLLNAPSGTIEFTPQQAQEVVINSDLENTPAGKQILKSSIQGKLQGKNIAVEISKDTTNISQKTPGGIGIKSVSLVTPTQPANTSLDMNTEKSATIEPNGNSSSKNNTKGGTGQSSLSPQNDLSSTQNPEPIPQANNAGAEVNPGVTEPPVGSQSSTPPNAEGGNTPKPGSDNSTPLLNNPKVETPPIKTVGGSGEQVESKHANYVEAQAISKKLIDKPFETLSTHEKAVMKDQRAMAENLYKENPELAKRVANGEANAPEGMLAEVIHNYVISQTKDVGSLFKTANSPFNDILSAKGQGLRASREFREPNNPAQRTVDAIKEINKTINDANKNEIESKIAKLQKSGKAETEKINLSKEDLKWENFLDSIKC